MKTVCPAVAHLTCAAHLTRSGCCALATARRLAIFEGPVIVPATFVSQPIITPPAQLLDRLYKQRTFDLRGRAPLNSANGQRRGPQSPAAQLRGVGSKLPTVVQQAQHGPVFVDWRADGPSTTGRGLAAAATAMEDDLPAAPLAPLGQPASSPPPAASVVDWTVGTVFASLGLFLLAGLAEIGGGWLVWQTIR